MNNVIQRIEELSQPLQPHATGRQPVLPTLAGIRAVVFDVYGTLLISGSGDISLTSGASHAEAAAAAIAHLGLGQVDGQQVLDLFKATIQQHHQTSDQAYPEVEIRDVWQHVLQQLGITAEDSQLPLLAIEYECRVNPIWPMPGLAESLTRLSQANISLGIVSNAQFFTPLAFPAVTGRTLEQWGFDPQLCIWSYFHRQAKPGVGLYELSRAALETKGISPAETLYIGNDLRNDVWPAQQLGMHTALFSGDARSLRLREDDPRLTDVRPDVEFTDLRQVLSVLSLADS